MKRRIGRRLVSLLLTFVTILTLLPAMTLPALAAKKGNLGGLTNADIELNFEGNINDPWKPDGRKIEGSIQSKSGYLWDTHYHSTLTIKNKKCTKATLSFKYTVAVNGGTINVGDLSSVTENGTFSTELAKDASIKVYIKSGSTKAPTKITMTDVNLVADATATVTFLPTEKGSYTVDGKPVTEESTSTQSAKTPYQVVATPEPGYQFMDWYDVNNNKSISRLSETELNIEKDCTIKARFATSGLALFETGGLVYDDLTNAITAASGKPSAIITQVGDGTISGSYTIPSSVTLLIPCDDAHTVFTEMPGTIGNKQAEKNQGVYTKLTMESGTKLVVNGAISVAANVSSANSSYTALPTGKFGQIEMQDGASIVLESGSSLYCWGFITGKGDIVAKSGSKVYEEFQIADHRGGSKTSTLNNEEKTFPFSQYYVQNIEARLEIQYGAIEEAVCRMYATTSNPADITLHFIAKDKGGLFNLTSANSKFVKWYDPKTERVSYELYNDANLSSILLSMKVVVPVTVNSANFNLPIMQNTTINVKSGTTTIDQSLCLIPGSQVIIDEGATVKIASGKSLFVYDRSDWVYKEWDTETIDVNGQKKPKYINSGFTYPGSTDFRPEYYTPSRSSDSWKSHFTTADMKDVKFDVNGTLNVAGKLYTTAGGADITSSLGSGKVVLSTAPTGDVTTHQYMQSRKEYKSSSGKYENDVSGYKEITANPAKLKNADGADKPYTETKDAKAGDTFTYCTCTTCGGGKWTNTNDLQVAAIINGNEVKTCATLQAAVDTYSPDNSTAPKNYIQMLHSTTESITTDKDLYLDLNGCTVKGDISVTDNHKLYGMDSSAKADYTTAPTGKIVGTVKGYAPTYQTPGDTNDRYVAISVTENGTSNLSFHRFNISVSGYRFELKAPECALFFIGKFQGDKAAKNHLTKLGFTLTDIDKTEKKYGCTITGKTIPLMPTGGGTSTSEVVQDAEGAYFFEAYLMRSFDKSNPAAYQTKISATAQATFDNGGKQDSEPKLWSFEDAWTNPGELDPAQQEILDNFREYLGIPKQTE